jgi:AraC-like DNA-binding protein
MRVAEFTSELGRWDEVERPADPRLCPYVHGYFATSSSLVRPTWQRHLPGTEVPLILNFGAAHTVAGQQLDHAWVTGLQTRSQRSVATGERQFMVVRFTPLGAHLFLRLSMDTLTDQTVALDQLSPRVAALVNDDVMIAQGWAERFDAMERLIGGRVIGSAAPTIAERAWNELVRSGGQTPVRWLAADAGCSHRHLIQQVRAGIGLTPKRLATLLRFNRAIGAVDQNSSNKPLLEGSPLAEDACWARIAAECGYFDQSHFIRDFKAFAGVTPSELRRGIP